MRNVKFEEARAPVTRAAGEAHYHRISPVPGDATTLYSELPGYPKYQILAIRLV